MQNTPENTLLLSAVGEAISCWSTIEYQLSMVFNTLSEIDRIEKSSALFDGIISLEIRLGICCRLIVFEDLDDVETEMWFRLASKITKSYKKRHQLAHYTLGTFKNRPAISPFFTNDKFLNNAQTYLFVGDIQEKRDQFMEIAGAVGWFSIRLLNLKRGQSEGFSQLLSQEPALVPRIRALAIQILEDRRRPSPPVPHN